MNLIENYINNLIEQFNNKKIIAKDKNHLEEFIQKEIKLKGNECDLNHIDVSEIG
jgi:hypothetical protein